MDEEQSVARPTAHYPPADVTPAEFEEFVLDLFGAAGKSVDNLRVTLHDKVRGVDGTYDFDGTVRFSVAGVDFLVVVEAKRHKNPIKRELVQVLKDKVQSVGAHKGVMISTASYQRGALEYALTHGVALVTVTEGRFTYETRSLIGGPGLTRGDALASHGIPTFVGHAYTTGTERGAVSVTLMSTEYPDHLRACLLGLQS